MYIYTVLLRMVDTMESQNIDISSWDILYTCTHIYECVCVSVCITRTDIPDRDTLR